MVKRRGAEQSRSSVVRLDEELYGASVLRLVRSITRQSR
jgi:hypothetical protein